MSTSPREKEQSLGDGGSAYRVDARGAEGLLVGDQGTQINYFYNGTWTDGVAPPPLVGVHGLVDSPYRGLSAFEERDAGLFFGRDAAASEVLALMSRRLEGSGLLVVSGVSGAGKSSLLRAGVLPRLRGAGLESAPEAASWPCLVFTPGSEPLKELAARVAPMAGVDAPALGRALAADPSGFALTARAAVLAGLGVAAHATGMAAGAGQRRMLLVVDQCEQLFTQCEKEEARRAFIAALHAAATVGHGHGQLPAAVVVLVVRADFEARLADYSQLPAAVQDRYLLTSMTSLQLRMAITQPVTTVGSSIDGDLVHMLLEEVPTRIPGSPSASIGSPAAGVLPLLSHALDQAWRSRTGQTLTLADYGRVGGIEGAVASSAERAYSQLTTAQQAVARQVFTRLTATSSDGANTASRAARTDLTAGKNEAQVRDVETVLETFAAERLLTLAAGTVQISHEVLLTAWPLLRDTWLTETHADRLIRTRLHSGAGEWIRSSSDSSYLYAGSLLEAAVDAAARIEADARHMPLSQAEKDFLRASQRAGRRRARRGQVFGALLIVLVVGFAAATVVAVHAGQTAARQRNFAISDQLASESQALGNTNATVSHLESIAAWGINHSAEARYAMLTAAARPQIATFTVGTSTVGSVAFSPNGKILATGSSGGAQLWDLVNLRRIGPPLGGGTGSSSPVVAFSPNGKILAVGRNDGTVHLWNVATRQQSGEPLGVKTGDVITSIAFSPRGRMLAVISNSTARVWNLSTHQPIKSFLTGGGAASLTAAAFSPDGKLLATGGVDGGARLWDVATGQQVGSPLNHDPAGVVVSVAFSPDGKILATGGFSHATMGSDNHSGALRLWNVATGQQIGAPLVDSTTGPIESVAFSPDGTTLATGSSDGTARLWNVTAGKQTGNTINSPINSPVASVAFSPDGTTLATGSSDGTARLWNVTAGRPIGRPLNANDAVYSVAFSPDGKSITTANANGTEQKWAVATHRQIGRPLMNLGNPIAPAAFSADGKIVAVDDSIDGTVRLGNLATHRQIGRLLVDPNLAALGMAFSPDGKILATGGASGAIRLWNLATRQQIGAPLKSAGAAVQSAAFSPDGKILATGDRSGAIRLWDVATRHQIGGPLKSATTGRIDAIAFSPDGTTLATGSDDGGAVQLWNTTTGQQIGGPLTSDISSTEGIGSVAFSPDGTTLATGSANGAVLVWDVATHQQIGGPLTIGNYAIWSVAFSPDGRTLAVGSGDGMTRLWNVSYLANVLDRLCSQIGGSLTRAQWTQYVPYGPTYWNICR